MHKNRPPIGMGEEGGQNIRTEHEAHREKDRFERLEAARDGQVPEHQCNRDHKPDPWDVREQLEATAHSSQIGCYERDIADDQQERGRQRYWTPILLAQELRQSFVTDAPDLSAGELHGVIEGRGEQYQP